MVKSDNKTAKLSYKDILGDVCDVDLKTVNDLTIKHNSRDLFDDVWAKRLYTDKLTANDVKNLTVDVDNNTVSFTAKITVDFAKIFKTANDVLILKSKKGDVLFSKCIKGNKLTAIDVDKHNKTAISKKGFAKKSIALSDVKQLDLTKINSADDLITAINNLNSK